MGRWGWRLFEGDQDLDIVLSLSHDGLGIKTGDWEHRLSTMVHQTDMLAPQEAVALYSTPEYAHSLANVIVPYVRQRLDTDNLGERMFAASRAMESERDDLFQESKYRTIIFGARINAADLQHLRDLVPQVNCTSRRTIFEDHGFRSPGKAQFLAALDHYQPGVARSFQEPSCFKCGKIEDDIGHKPLQCKKCKVATYCSKDCQRDQWREHRVSCIPPGQRRMLNV
ncbi:Zinc finger, MYND-type [Penicillium expansum]|uniref:Zinc finger, MYND-type n=1 Tax=Penicillium expansum TaxID=27334 RepID=A0A0A2I6B3_PENEN|nr:Zinc finger, MYND-type [Penicillium expansum]KGO38617.1 Zinc finger, MYND-type [Penicillium expansum]KGO59479.1 Zinc finger, MYND-type [Penicillium expansum]